MSGETVQEKFTNTYFRILDDPKVKKEIKMFCIFQLLHDDAVSLHKAWELAEENGLVSKSYVELDYELSCSWMKYFKGA